MNRSRFLPLLFVFSLVFTTSAQIHRWRGDSLPTNLILRHYLMGGVSWIDVDQLNSRLDGLDLTGFSSYNLSLGYGWDMIYDRVMTGGNIEALLWRKNSDDGTRAGFWAGRININTGFQVLSQENLFLYPILGLGLGIASLWVGPDQVPFGTAVNSPSPDNLWQFSIVINLGAGFDVKLPAWRKFNNSIVGIRAGYFFDPVRSTDWRKGGSEVTGGPDVNLQGPYIQAILGKGVTWPHQSQ
ncbi:MAG: hypothetical protein GX089_07795 [Fibrobacter sp.]|nr:hypothetical protein [Fibrobacter sp.]